MYKIISGILLILVITQLFFLGKYIPLEYSIRKIANRKYTDNYVCKNFSEDLVRELSKYGIQSEIEIGESPKTAKQDNVVHAWVGIWVEPQTGSFVINYLK